MNPAATTLMNGEVLAEDKRARLARLMRERSGRPRSAPTSFSQQRLWFLDQLTPGNPFYNVAIAVRLKAPLDVAILERCLNEIVRRHEVLRTTFGVADGQPVQIIAPELKLALGVVDLEHLPAADRETEARRLATVDAGKPFDLAQGPLLRASLLRLGFNDHLFLLSQHHIVSDGWSMGIFSRELTELYTAFAMGRSSPLPEPALQYSDFAVWQRRWLQGENLERQLGYWIGKLASLPILQLPTDRARPPVQTYRGSTHTFTIPAGLATALKRLTEATGSTLFITLLAAFKALLVRYTSQEDLVIGTYIANRNRAEVEGILGFFVNTLVLRTDASGEPTFRELLRRVREVALEAYAHQDVPFEMLVERLHPERDLSRNPLFQVVFQIPTGPTVAREAATSEATPLLDVKPASAIFDLSVSVWESGPRLTGQMEYSCDLFDPATIERLAAHYVLLLEKVVADPDVPVTRPSLLTPVEQRLLLEDWNRASGPWPRESSLTELFDQQVRRTPDAPAFLGDDAVLTFAELDRRSRRLARRLRESGVTLQVPVGIGLERSLDLPVALLAVWRAGGIYVPLDPAYPPARLAFMAEAARVRVVVTQAALCAQWPPDTTTIRLDDATPASGDAGDDGVPSGDGPHPASDELAYIIFTSGSTGRPKGVGVEHSQILNRLAWMWAAYPFEPGEMGCQKSSLNFVDSLWELLGPLLRGVPTVIAPDEIVRDPWRLIEFLGRHGVTRLWLVPSLLRALLESGADLPSRLPRLGFWVSSGEALPAELFHRFREVLPSATLYNLYGTSEVWDVTWFDPRREAPVGDLVPIGRVIPNLEVYVLDGGLQPTPLGVPGELFVGGLGLARGYVHQPELTAEKFIPHPFSAVPGARLYRTGDLARFRADGNLEFLGRLDQQLKVRGYRVEPAEVEAVLLGHPAVNAAVVAARRGDRPGDPATLAAFLVARDGADLTGIDWRSWSETRLPAHLVPASFEFLEALPLLPNGKVHRQALADSQGPARATRTPYAAPRTPTETILVRIWGDLFRARQVGVHDHFFRDLGGHSLMATQLVSRIRDELRVEIPLRCLFQSPTASGLAAEVDRLRAAPPPDGPALVRLSRERYRLGEKSAGTPLASSEQAREGPNRSEHP